MSVPLTVVVAVYNMQQYLPRFVQSLQLQTFKNFEVLFIDDASTDDSAAMLEGYASTDLRFHVLHNAQNMGLGRVCNLGIRSTRTETICFADPDDLLPENSLEVRLAAYKKHNAIVRACHNEITSDGLLINHEVRPDLPEICKPSALAQRIGPNPFLCAHWTWLFPTGLLQKNNIFHGEDMRTADDIYMLTHLFYHIQRLVWLPDTVYHWIKRTDSLSTTRYTPEHYENYFRCCNVFYQESVKNNNIKLADIFYDGYLFAYLLHLLKQVQDGKSMEDDVQRVVRDAARVCTRHKGFERLLADEKNMAFKHPGFFLLWQTLRSTAPSMVQRLASSRLILSQHQQILHYERIRQQGWDKNVRFDKFDVEQNLVRARYYFCDTHPEEKYMCDGALNEPAFTKNCSVFTGKDYNIFERILWLQLPAKDEDHCSLTVGEQATALNHNVGQIRDSFTPKPLDDRNFPADVRALRHLAQSSAMQKRFQNAWMFIDRDTQADDNAEHLYRWIMHNKPGINAWFVLREESAHWPRLQKEGFRLIPFGSMEHNILFFNATRLISSQMDIYIYAWLEDRYYGDLKKFKYISLQHGVIKENLSPWINTIDMDVFVTTTVDEYHSIIDDSTDYVLTRKEVIRSGLPRHDALLAVPRPEKRFFIMPTWRADLAGSWDGKGQQREYNPRFIHSHFARTWNALISSSRFKALLQKYEYEAVFWPHPGFADYLNEFQLSENIRRPKNESIQDLLKTSILLITDYSSITFDMAFMHRPTIYYQFDSLAEFSLRQNRRPGYFSYEKDGFGPVCNTEDEIIEWIEGYFSTGCQCFAQYMQRIKKIFHIRDGKNCERIYHAIC
ncbi:MAG: CDP-glycerol glycerophosphotransferase family protein [Desulfomicrobium sp.]|nr:CDP-glycerol glycerophosphotransferase family protein [Desulfomicrobium sp.]